MTVILATLLSKKGKDAIPAAEESNTKDTLPDFMAAFAGPLVVIVLLTLRPLFGISVDPQIALPLGGLVCVLVTGNAKHTIEITNSVSARLSAYLRFLQLQWFMQVQQCLTHCHTVPSSTQQAAR